MPGHPDLLVETLSRSGTLVAYAVSVVLFAQLLIPRVGRGSSEGCRNRER